MRWVAIFPAQNRAARSGFRSLADWTLALAEARAAELLDLAAVAPEFRHTAGKDANAHVSESLVISRDRVAERIDLVEQAVVLLDVGFILCDCGADLRFR